VLLGFGSETVITHTWHKLYRLQSADFFRCLCAVMDTFLTSDDFWQEFSELRELDDEWTGFCACIRPSAANKEHHNKQFNVKKITIKSFTCD